MDVVDDGSASPDSADENIHSSEDQILSKNRSKRKPSKTQIKHIAQGAFGPPSLNGQAQASFRETRNNLAGSQNQPTERRKGASSKNVKYGSAMSSDIDSSFSLDTQVMVQEEIGSSQQHLTGTSGHVTTCSSKAMQETTMAQTVSSGLHTLGPNITVPQPSTFQISPARQSTSQLHPASSNPSPRPSSSASGSGRPSPCYPCAICGKVFRVPSRFDSHMLGHSKGKPFCCNTCGKMFASQEKLDRHLPVHNCDRHAAFTCETCGKVCVNWRAYLYHIKAKHTESGGKRFSCNMEMDSLLEVKKSDPNSSYTCTSCGKVCVNWRAYVYHQKSRHSETDGKKFSCNICGRQFYTKHRLKKHAIGHQKGKHHCCQVCGKLFESHKKLTVHSLVHNLSSMHDQNLQCGDCGRTYSDWIPFKQHMKTHATEGVCYACGLCEETFATQYDLEKHRRVHKQFQCEFCDRYFRSASVLSVHLRIHTGERPYHCGLCNRDFSQSCVLKVHMRTHAKDGRYECKACGLVLHDVMEYFQHHISHLEAGNLQCEECGKMFDNINNKNRHMATHRDRDCHHCHVCGKEFGRVSHLEAHMLSHSELDPTPLTCKVCSKTFSSQDLLTAHYSSHVSGDASSSSKAVLSGAAHSRPMFCGVCGKMFKDREYLNKHMRKHDKEAQKAIKFEKFIDEDVVKVENGQFACVDCGKAFGKLDHLTVHRREHTGECPHSCCMCGQSFMLRSQLLKHIREHRQSGVMMYLNLDAGEVCATTMSDSDIKDVIKFTSAGSGLTGTGTKGLNGETSSRIKSTSIRPESLHQLQPSTQSQNDGKPEEYYQNQPEAAKSSCNTDTIQYNFPLRNQIPPHNVRVNSQDDRYHHQHHHPHPSTQINMPLRSGSISLDIQTPVTPSMAHSQHPMSHKEQELVSSADSHLLRASNFEAMSPSAHSIPVTHNVNQAYSTAVKEGSFLFSPQELSLPLVCSDQITAPVSQNTILPRANNGHLQQHQQPQQQVDNNQMVISSEQPLALVTMGLSSNPPLIQNPKSNLNSSQDNNNSSSMLSVVSHHAPPRLYVTSSPTTISLNNNNNNVVLSAAHHPHPHLSVSAAANAHAAHGNAGARFINPDLHHSLVSHFQLLPQTAFPENSQHM